MRAHLVVAAAVAVGTACGSYNEEPRPTPEAGAPPPVEDASVADASEPFVSDSGTPGPTPGTPSAAYRDAVLADGPVAYWRCNERAGGSLLADERGDHRAVLSSQSPKLGLPGLFDTADSGSIAFDGTVGMLASAPTVPFRAGSAFSIELWFRPGPGVLDNNFRNLVTHANIQDGRALGIYFVNGALEAETFLAGVKRWISVSAPAAEQWHHIVFTHADKSTLYVDGVPSTSLNEVIAHPNATESFMLGAKRLDSVSVVGRLTEVAFYDRALPDSRVEQHLALGRPK